jgi:hypothetical protein
MTVTLAGWWRRPVLPSILCIGSLRALLIAGLAALLSARSALITLWRRGRWLILPVLIGAVRRRRWRRSVRRWRRAEVLDEFIMRHHTILVGVEVLEELVNAEWWRRRGLTRLAAMAGLIVGARRAILLLVGL